jgi:hypothetical protein
MPFGFISASGTPVLLSRDKWIWKVSLKCFGMCHRQEELLVRRLATVEAKHYFLGREVENIIFLAQFGSAPGAIRCEF